MKKLLTSKVEVTGDIPSPRFGHTLTMVSSDKAILFGGAVSISGKFVITNETFLFDFLTMKWKKLNFKQGFIPSERAAHASVKVADLQMIIYGGAASGCQGLLKDQLYILDLRKQYFQIINNFQKTNLENYRSQQQRCDTGPKIWAYNRLQQTFFSSLWRNSGSKAENDVWLLNINKGPFQWQNYELNNKIAPCPRVYHSAAICEQGSAQGMMVVFGGSKQSKKDTNNSQRESSIAALNDVWRLRKHRDGTWDWVKPLKSQSYTPLFRYQHFVIFMESMLLIVGGRSNSSEQIVDTIEVYDTQTSEWHKSTCLSRYRHAIALYNKDKLFVHGGFEPQLVSQPLQTMVEIDLAQLFSTNVLVNTNNSSSKSKENLCTQTNLMQNTISQRLQNQRKQLRQINESERNMSSNSRVRHNNQTDKLNKSKLERGQRDLTPSRIINSSKSIRLSNQVVVAKGDNNQIQIQRMNVNELMEESKKLTSIQQDSQVSDTGIIQSIQNIISILMPTTPNQLKNFTLFPFKRDKIMRLCQQVSKILNEQTSLLGARSPAKIFGSFYGRFQDLLNIFENFGYPDDKQMEIVEQIFVGNYVDKGFNSLETICLLMALKIKYPDHIKLLRGKHQDSNINRICGFGQECSIRLGQNINDPLSCFNAINAVFDLMPFAVAIEDKYLCLNSGIGSIIDLITVKDISRPVKVKNNQNVMDLLWSQEKGLAQLGYESKKCSQAYLEQFLDQNGLQMIIDTKDGLKNGVEDDGLILSISSIPNYANSLNKGCILKITKDLQIAPCIVNGNGLKKTPWVNELNTKININMNEKQANLRKNMFEI